MRKFTEVVLEVEGVEVAAKVRNRQRRAISKDRDLARHEAREFKREREYA